VLHISLINKINLLSVAGNRHATQHLTSKLKCEAMTMDYHTFVEAVIDGYGAMVEAEHAENPMPRRSPRI
jgi:urease accessory protein UreE